MSLIFVDCEAYGGAPSVGELTEFGCVEYKTMITFHGILFDAKPNPKNPAESKPIKDTSHITDEGRKKVFQALDSWLKQFPPPYIFISDNPAYDWQWISYGCWKYLRRNPFGHSARRISDFYAGLMGDFSNTQKWKRLRVTKHDHNPVHDAVGNAEAFRRIINGER